MAKFLLVIAALIVVYLLLRRQVGKRGDATPPSDASTPAGEENMVRCRVCGVHLPLSEAVTARGDFFCSKEHLQLADRERGSR